MTITMALGGGWVSDWEFWVDGVVVPFAIEGEDLGSHAAQAVDLLADELAARRAVLGRQTGTVRMTVAGIRAPADYGALLAYLESLEFVQSVSVVEVVDARLVLELNTPADPDELLLAFERDRRMFDDRLAVSTAADLKVFWRGDD